MNRSAREGETFFSPSARRSSAIASATFDSFGTRTFTTSRSRVSLPWKCTRRDLSRSNAGKGMSSTS